MREPFTFGIPLIARTAAGDWGRVLALLDLTLASVRAQTDGDFRVIIAGHHAPRLERPDDRVSFLPMDWAPDPPDLANRDSGRKKDAIRQAVLARGGGLLMFLDADDWLDTRLVATARARLSQRHVGGVVRKGRAVDIRGLRTAPIPCAALFPRSFHRLCGSSTIARLRSTSPHPLRRDPFLVLHDHHSFIEAAGRHRLPIADLPLGNAYVVNSAENHSELHGPFAEWRRAFSQGVHDGGTALDARTAAGFGLDLAAVRRVAQRLAAAAPPDRNRANGAGRAFRAWQHQHRRADHSG